MPENPKDYIPEICSSLNLGSNVKEKSLEIIDQAEGKNLIKTYKPKSVAAAVVYLSSILCGDKRTQREVTDVSDVTEPTIQRICKELTEKLDIEIVR